MTAAVLTREAAARGKWNPGHHPRDARGRFTKSATRVLKASDRKRAAAALQGFKPADLGPGAVDGAAWLSNQAAGKKSKDEAVARYFNGGWKTTHNTLRTKKDAASDPDVQAIDKAMAPLSEDVMLERRVSLKMFAHIPMDELQGMKVRDAAYQPAALQGSQGEAPDGMVTLHMAVPAGTKALINADTGQVVLDRDTEIAISRVEPNGRGGYDLYGAVIPKQGQTRPARDQGNGDQGGGDQGGTDSTGGDQAGTGGPDTAGGSAPAGGSTPAKKAAPRKATPAGDQGGAQPGDTAPAKKATPARKSTAGTSTSGTGDTSRPAGENDDVAGAEAAADNELAAASAQVARNAAEHEATTGRPAPTKVSDLERNDFVSVAGERPDGRRETHTGYVSTPNTIGGQTWLTVSDWPDSQGVRRAMRVEPDGDVFVQPHPTDKPVVLYRNPKSGKPMPNATYVEQVRGLAVRDPDREQKVRDRVAELSGTDATPDLPDGAPQVAAPEGSRLAELSPVDRATLGVLVEDQGPGIFQSPMNGGNLSDVGRYVSDTGTARDLVDRYGADTVWKAAEEHARAHPEILARTPDEVRARVEERDRLAGERATAAAAATKAGDYQGARDAIDAGELIDPEYRQNFRSWDEMRSVVGRVEQKNAGKPAQPAQDAPAAPDVSTAGPDVPDAVTSDQSAPAVPAVPVMGQAPAGFVPREQRPEYRKAYLKGAKESAWQGGPNTDLSAHREKKLAAADMNPNTPSGWYDGWFDVSTFDRGDFQTARRIDAEEIDALNGDKPYVVRPFTTGPDGERIPGRTTTVPGLATLNLELAGHRGAEQVPAGTPDARGEHVDERGRGVEWGPSDGAGDITPAQGGAPAAPAEPSAQDRAAKLDTDIRDAVEKIADGPVGLVSLARVRDQFPDVARADMDAALLRLDRARVLQLDPNPDRRNMTDQDRSAAIPLAGEDMHLVSVVRPIDTSSSLGEDLTVPPPADVPAPPVPPVDVPAAPAAAGIPDELLTVDAAKPLRHTLVDGKAAGKFLFFGDSTRPKTRGVPVTITQQGKPNSRGRGGSVLLTGEEHGNDTLMRLDLGGKAWLAPMPASGTPDAPGTPGDQADPATAIRNTLDDLLAGRPDKGAEISVTELRDRLPATLDRNDVDMALKQLHRDNVINLFPNSQQGDLTAQHRADAVTVGSQPMHLLTLGADHRAGVDERVAARAGDTSTAGTSAPSPGAGRTDGLEAWAPKADGTFYPDGTPADLGAQAGPGLDKHQLDATMWALAVGEGKLPPGKRVRQQMVKLGYANDAGELTPDGYAAARRTAPRRYRGNTVDNPDGGRIAGGPVPLVSNPVTPAPVRSDGALSAPVWRGEEQRGIVLPDAVDGPVPEIDPEVKAKLDGLGIRISAGMKNAPPEAKADIKAVARQIDTPYGSIDADQTVRTPDGKVIGRLAAGVYGPQQPKGEERGWMYVDTGQGVFAVWKPGTRPARLAQADDVAGDGWTTKEWRGRWRITGANGRAELGTEYASQRDALADLTEIRARRASQGTGSDMFETRKASDLKRGDVYTPRTDGGDVRTVTEVKPVGKAGNIAVYWRDSAGKERFTLHTPGQPAYRLKNAKGVEGDHDGNGRPVTAGADVPFEVSAPDYGSGIIHTYAGPETAPDVVDSVSIGGQPVMIVRYATVKKDRVDGTPEFGHTDTYYAVPAGVDFQAMSVRFEAEDTRFGRKAGESSFDRPNPARPVDNVEIASGKSPAQVLKAAQAKLEREAAWEAYAGDATRNVGVHDGADFNALSADAPMKPGDLVMVYSHQKYRTAVVTRVTPTKVEAIAATPSNPESPNGITATKGSGARLLQARDVAAPTAQGIVRDPAQSKPGGAVRAAAPSPTAATGGVRTSMSYAMQHDGGQLPPGLYRRQAQRAGWADGNGKVTAEGRDATITGLGQDPVWRNAANRDETVARMRAYDPDAAPSTAGTGTPDAPTVDAPTAPAADAPAPGANLPPVVAGSRNDMPFSENIWGGIGDSPVNYHDDGHMGFASKNLGADARLDVDGLPLKEWIDRKATDAVSGKITAQQQLDDMRELHGRLPEGPGKRAVGAYLSRIDTPQRPVPETPDFTPAPLQRLMADLNAVPAVREDNREIGRLQDVITRFGEGRMTARGLIDEVRRGVLNNRHESEDGKAEIDRAANRAIADLETLRKTDRAALTPDGARERNASTAGASAPDAPAPAPTADVETRDLFTPEQLAAAGAVESAPLTAADLQAAAYATDVEPAPAAPAAPAIDTAAIQADDEVRVAGANGTVLANLGDQLQVRFPGNRVQTVNARDVREHRPAQRQTDIMGGSTAFVPGSRAGIGVADRGHIGRDSAALTQQLGMFDVGDQQQIEGQTALMDSLMQMPAVEVPQSIAPALPADAPEPAGINVPDDLSGLSDEQLSGIFSELNNADASALDEAGMARILGEWETREQAMNDLVARVPDDLSTLSDDQAMSLFADLTAFHGTMSGDHVARLEADLDRRDQESHDWQAKRDLVARDPRDLEDYQVLADAINAAADLDDQPAVERLVAELDRRDAEDIAREAAAAQADRDRLAGEQRAQAAEATAESAAAEMRRILEVGEAENAAINDRLEAEDLRFRVGQAGENVADQADRIASDRFRNETPALNQDFDPAIVDEFYGKTDAEVKSTAYAGWFGTGDVKAKAERAMKEHQRREALELARRDNAESSRKRRRLLTTPVGELTDDELADFPAILQALPPGEQLDTVRAVRVPEVLAESNRRMSDRDRTAAALAAGPAGPVKVTNPLQALADVELQARAGMGNTDTWVAANMRLNRAKGHVYGIAGNPTGNEIASASKKDPRDPAEQAALVLAWYRHLGEFDADVTPTSPEWIKGPADEPNLPNVVDPLPTSNIRDGDKILKDMLRRATIDRDNGDDAGEWRYNQATARALRIPFDPADRSPEAKSRLFTAAANARRRDPRTPKQQAAAIVAEWRRLAAEEGVDPTDSLRYGPAEKVGKPRGGHLPNPTAAQEARINALVAQGVDWPDAYADALGLSRTDVSKAETDSMMLASNPSAKNLTEAYKTAYSEMVAQAYTAAETGTRGHMLNDAGKRLQLAGKLDTIELFSGPSSRAYKYASEELLRWWAEQPPPRMSFAEWRSDMQGDAAGRASAIQRGKGNEFR